MLTYNTLNTFTTLAILEADVRKSKSGEDPKLSYIKYKLNLQWNPDFSNPHFFRTKSCFPSSVEHCNFTPDFSNYPIFRTNSRFPSRFKKSVFHCSTVLLPEQISGFFNIHKRMYYFISHGISHGYKPFFTLCCSTVLHRHYGLDRRPTCMYMKTS